MGVILVTGTSSGLGLLLSVELARRGEIVFASMRDTGRAGPLREAASEAGVSVEVVSLDVNDPDSVGQAVASMVAQAGRIDVAVNNAAIPQFGPLERVTDAELSAVLDTNLAGPVRVARAVLPVMRTQGSGRIVNVSSSAAEPKFGLRLWSIYAISKAGLHALSYELAKEIAPLGLHAVLVEGGVRGLTNAWSSVHAAREAFNPDSSPYGRIERGMAQLQAGVGAFMDDGTAAATMIADACLVENPPIRYPPIGQAVIDGHAAISDEDFLDLCRFERTHEILTAHQLPPFAWNAVADQ